MSEKRKPICYVIAGPNGSGKTTFALNYLPEIASCHNFVNADMIAYGISPLDSVAVQIEAGKLFLHGIYKNIEKQTDFAFETTLAGRSYINLLKKLRKNGWKIVLFFLWIPNADFSRDRVRQRVQEGGHDIPDEAIYRRYPRIMYNLLNIYMPLCDEISCYDNSNPEPIPFFEHTSQGRHIINHEIFSIIERYSNEYKNK